MLEPLLPRLKQEIEARLEELRPIVAEVEQLEAAKAALLARGDAASAAGRAPSGRRAGADPARRAAGRGGRAPRGANREAILRLVEERPGVSVAEIAAVTRIAKPTVATTVSKLKREGVLADEAGGVKLASRQPVTLAAVAGAAAAPDADGGGDGAGLAAPPAAAANGRDAADDGADGA